MSEYLNISNKLFPITQRPKVDLANLKRAEVIMAKIVVKYGEIYLPIFERIRQERVEWEKKECLLEIAKTIANDNSKL